MFLSLASEQIISGSPFPSLSLFSLTALILHRTNNKKATAKKRQQQQKATTAKTGAARNQAKSKTGVVINDPKGSGRRHNIGSQIVREVDGKISQGNQAEQGAKINCFITEQIPARDAVVKNVEFEVSRKLEMAHKDRERTLLEENASLKKAVAKFAKAANSEKKKKRAIRKKQAKKETTPSLTPARIAEMQRAAECMKLLQEQEDEEARRQKRKRKDLSRPKGGRPPKRKTINRLARVAGVGTTPPTPARDMLARMIARYPNGLEFNFKNVQEVKREFERLSCAGAATFFNVPFDRMEKLFNGETTKTPPTRNELQEKENKEKTDCILRVIKAQDDATIRGSVTHAIRMIQAGCGKKTNTQLAIGPKFIRRVLKDKKVCCIVNQQIKPALTKDQMKKRVKWCKAMLEKYRANSEFFKANPVHG
jgi:hypothetical protein